jgi:hypothetical protein
LQLKEPDICIPAIYNYYDSYSSSLNYVCAPDTTYCGSSIAPFCFASGTVYDSIGAEDVLLCLEGENYRCFMPSDWCNLGQGVRSTTQDLNGYKCMCATEVIGFCAWRDAPIGEMDSLANCCDNIDNNCNGLIDSAESGCPAEESEAARPGSCSDGRDNDCDGLIDCDDDGCMPDCCVQADCETYGETQCNSCAGYCNWANGHCCEDGYFWDLSADDGEGGTGACVTIDPCAPICWRDFCVMNSVACCDGGDGYTYREQVSRWQP